MIISLFFSPIANYQTAKSHPGLSPYLLSFKNHAVDLPTYKKKAESFNKSVPTGLLLS